MFLIPTRQLYLKLFGIYLFVNCLLESVSSFLAYHGANNVLLSNLITVLDFTFYFYLLYAIVQSPLAKKIFLYILILFPIASLANILFLQKSAFHTMTYSLGCLLVVGFCIYYFLELFQRKTSSNLVREPAFWICSGLLFYFTCTFPLYAVLNIIKGGFQQGLLMKFLAILVILNIFLYLSFTIAFLCRLRTRKSM